MLHLTLHGLAIIAVARGIGGMNALSLGLNSILINQALRGNFLLPLCCSAPASYLMMFHD